jgi:hypothetical protein
LKTPANVSGLKPSPHNPRKISPEDLEKLKEALGAFGDLGGIVFNITTGELVGGHQRVKNLDPKWKITKHPARDKQGTIALGWIETPFGRLSYREVHWPRKKELAANLAANKISGEWDLNLLAPILVELKDFPEIDLTGFNEKEINAIIAEILPTDPEEERDAIPELPKEAKTKPGDIWSLGDHRILCGDATSTESWTALMSGKKAALCITDFPYGVEYNVNNKTQYVPTTGMRIPNRTRPDLAGDETTDVATKILPLIFENLIDEGVAYFTCGTGLEVDIINWLREREIHYGTTMVWHKHFPVVSWNRYHAEHELIVYCGKGSRPGQYARWFGPKNETTVWDIPLDAHGERLHPTQKPVELFRRGIRNSSGPNEIVIDPCFGSGPALIACEQLSRVFYGMEIEPRYVDVAVKRWENLTGRKATVAHS